eukprot:scaffold245335_cov32-Prasinocladus_malaysianus.AAC.2
MEREGNWNLIGKELALGVRGSTELVKPGNAPRQGKAPAASNKAQAQRANSGPSASHGEDDFKTSFALFMKTMAESKATKNDALKVQSQASKMKAIKQLAESSDVSATVKEAAEAKLLQFINDF